MRREEIEGLGIPLARSVEYHEEISSTQERARELASKPPYAPHGTLVISGVQEGGRGRLGRSWGSPRGGLWMSLVLRPDIPASSASRITQTAAVGIAKALWEIDVEARIKWPNDLMVGERKICGILAESHTKSAGPRRDPRLDFIVLGVGLNANLDPEDLGVTDREIATLRFELGHDVDLLRLLDIILRSLATEIERLGRFDAVLEDWRALDCTLGRRVRVRRSGEILEGEAVDLSPEGALLLHTGEGLVELFEGEVEYARRIGR